MLIPRLVRSALLTSVLVACIGGQALADPVFYDGYKPPKDSLGRPDLTGVWGNTTATRLERPAEYGNRLVMTAQEADAIESRFRAADELALKPTDPKATVKDLPADCSASRGTQCNYNSFFTEPGSTVMRVHGEPRTSLITTTPNGRIPVNLQGKATRTEINPEDITPQPGQARPDPPGVDDNPETRGLTERCVSFLSPVILPSFYNNNIMIQQSRDSVAIESEMIHNTRIVRLNAKHRTDGVKQWGGDAIGWYEGDTLVVETTAFEPRQIQWWGGSDQMKVTERFTRVSPTKLYYAFTIEDPKTWARPWGGEYEFTSSPGIYEYACHEGNYALANILSGARYQEAQAKLKTADSAK